MRAVKLRKQYKKALRRQKIEQEKREKEESRKEEGQTGDQSPKENEDFDEDTSDDNEELSKLPEHKPKKDQGFGDVIRAKDPECMLLLGDNNPAESTDSGTIETGL